MRSLVSLLSLLIAAVVSVQSFSSSFENTAVVRTVELGGSTTHVTTTYQVRALENDIQQYVFVLSADDAARTSWLEAKVKGSSSTLKLEATGADKRVSLYSATLPKKLAKDDTITLVLTTVQSHASEPLPATIHQSSRLGLHYNSELYALSGYNTVIQRLKLRAPTANIISYAQPKYSKYVAGDSKLSSKQGTTVTYGPFRNVPPYTDAEFLHEDLKDVLIHYEYDSPVITIKTLKRAAEISHWGSNLNIQDNIWLKNDGAKLKGHFSRLDHIKQSVHTHTSVAHVVRDLVLHLPSGVRDPYYYDVIGNVSTSHFRPAPARRSSASSSLTRHSPLEKHSLLEMKPRYPLLGGWNYSFTLGYDMPLQEWASYDKASGKYLVAVPFLTPIPGAAFDDVEMRVILPEGAKLLEHHLPFPVDSEREENHITYLDTVGRPTIIFQKFNVTNDHSGLIYVSYTVDAKAHFQKPLTVAAAMFGLFTLGMTLRRLDFSIHSKKHV